MNEISWIIFIEKRRNTSSLRCVLLKRKKSERRFKFEDKYRYIIEDWEKKVAAAVGVC